MFDPDQCFFHGYEPIPRNMFRLCMECGHAWTEASLLVAYNELLKHLAEVYADDEEPVSDADTIHSCPLCGHDF